MISVPQPADPDLRVAIESHLPCRLPASSATAVFCFGHCFHRHGDVERLELIVDGRRHRPTATGMPRRDLYEWLHTAGAHGASTAEADPEGRSYRSGFWATMPVLTGEAPGTLELDAAVKVAGRPEVIHPLARIRVIEPQHDPPRLLPPGTIGICMATFDPDIALLTEQLDSLRAQTDERWICVISDGGSAPQRFDAILEAISDDPRFTASRSEERLDPYRNFERALRLLPASVELIALSDQDDRWHPDKLATLRDALGDAQLVYSDLRLVTRDGRILRDTLWRGRRNDHSNLASLLIANAVPGAAMLLRREVVETALPFPRTPAIQYHDHWLALAALASGEIRYVNRPLYDWVQHGGSVSDGRSRPGAGSSSRWRSAYFCGFMPREVWARTLLLRSDSRLSTRKRHALSWFALSGRSPACFAWLALRPLRLLLGRGETLGAEAGLARGIVWRWALPAAALPFRRPGLLPYDARFPDPPLFDQPRLRRWRSGS
jgi:glycosyltransferase involved in cell wall biosynthesis